MKKFNRIYLIICIIIALIFALIIAFYDAISTEEFVAKVNNPPQSEDYQLLKDYAMIYAKTFDKNSVADKNVQIIHNIEEGHVTITVNELRCGVKATFPAEVKKEENENEVTVIISYEDVSYAEYTNLESMGTYVAAIIFVIIAAFATSFSVIYGPAMLVVWLIYKLKASRRNNEQEKKT